MAGKTLVDLQLELLNEWKKYYEKPIDYARKIKSVARKFDPKAEIMLFGSIVKGSMKPNSDIDILIVTELARNTRDRLRLRVNIAREIGELTPFEIHIVTPEEYRRWYKRFIDKYIVV